MKRRKFLKYSTAGLSLPFWLQYCDFPNSEYPVKFNSDHKTGHLLFKSKEWKKVKGKDTEVAIVGGGIAGLTAAHQLKTVDFQLYELSHSLGGTVSTETYNGLQFSQGAHYDLAYPENYGKEVLTLLQELGLIVYEPWNKSWSFKDQRHIIPPFRRQQCYDFGNRRRDVIPESPLKNHFVELMLQYDGRMTMPTRLVDPTLRHLGKLTFKEFLTRELPVTEAFLRQVDYHMYDDYGGSSEMVSALAGIHYFVCRPYYTKEVPLFSPPNGNKYFAEALLRQMDSKRVNPSSMVQRIQKNGNEYELEILNVKAKQIEEVTARKVIYAGQKHALKYIFPEQAKLFANTYAPWMVVNLISDQTSGEYGFWQNEFLGDNEQFLGFIDSSVQSQAALKGKRVFTGYYCLDPADRAHLLSIEEAKQNIAEETQGYIEKMLQKSIKIEAGFIKVMGHAMPIPAPNYLFKDANDSADADMIYAGVDNGRLPLLFEAMDSGVQAAALV